MSVSHEVYQCVSISQLHGQWAGAGEYIYSLSPEVTKFDQIKSRNTEKSTLLRHLYASLEERAEPGISRLSREFRHTFIHFLITNFLTTVTFDFCIYHCWMCELTPGASHICYYHNR